MSTIREEKKIIERQAGWKEGQPISPAKENLILTLHERMDEIEAVAEWIGFDGR